MLISNHAFIFRGIYSARWIIHKYYILQRRYELRFETRTSEVGYEMRKEGDVGPRIFAGEVRFGADYEVWSREVIQGGEDLRSIESWIQWDLYLMDQLPLPPRSVRSFTSIAPSLNNA
jgi:hypothetical protein